MHTQPLNLSDHVSSALWKRVGRDGLSVETVAMRLQGYGVGCSVTNVKQMRAGDKLPTLPQTVALAQILGDEFLADILEPHGFTVEAVGKPGCWERFNVAIHKVALMISQRAHRDHRERGKLRAALRRMRAMARGMAA